MLSSIKNFFNERSGRKALQDRGLLETYTTSIGTPGNNHTDVAYIGTISTMFGGAVAGSAIVPGIGGIVGAALGAVAGYFGAGNSYTAYKIRKDNKKGPAPV